MTERPFVSVITAFYNAGAFLREAIESVLAQTYDNWEYWIVNDGATDGSAETARAAAATHPERVHYLEHPGGENRGVCSSRNLALQHAHGKYIAILDADDVWLPNKLAEQVRLANQHPQVGLLFGPSEYWRSWRTGCADGDHIPQLGPGERVYGHGELLHSSYPLGSFGAPCPSSLLIERETFCKVGGFEECLNRNHYEDQAFLAKLYLSTDVYISSLSLDRYRIHKDSACARAKQADTEDRARREYMDWLHNYLLAQRITDARIWKAWRRATFKYSHPLLSQVLKPVLRLRRTIAR